MTNLYPVRPDDEVIGIGIVALDVTDSKRLERSQQALTDAVVGALASAAEARDPYTAGHEPRVAEMGYDSETQKGIGLAASIHDVGKIAIPAEILSRPGRLSDEEMALVRCHAQAGHDILSGVEFPWPVADMVLQHHERLDGSGYPAHLQGDQINVGARIIAGADVVEAMSSHRPYRTAVGVGPALAAIQEGRGRIFDPAVVDACLRLVNDGRLAQSVPEGTQASGPTSAPTATAA